MSALAKRGLNRAPVLVRQDPVEDPAHVALLVDRIVLASAEDMRVLAQQPRAHRIERGRGNAACPFLAERVGQPESQRAGRTLNITARI